MDRGVIYLASGAGSYLGELLTSLASLRLHNPSLPVTVFSRFPISRPLPNTCTEDLESREHPLKLKVLTLRHSPYAETLFLDTDTTIRGSLEPIFSALEGQDLAVANSHAADWTVQPPRFTALVKPGDYNTGVILYRKSPALLSFLKVWEAAVQAQDPAEMWAGHFCDQYHFNRLVSAGTLKQHCVRFKELDNTLWNARGGMLEELRRLGRESTIRIFHHRTRTMKMRKLMYSLTNWHTVRELGRKALQRAKH